MRRAFEEGYREGVVNGAYGMSYGVRKIGERDSKGRGRRRDKQEKEEGGEGEEERGGEVVWVEEGGVQRDIYI